MFNRKKTSLTLLTGVLASSGLFALTSCGSEEKGIYEASNEMAAFRALTYLADTLTDDAGNPCEDFKMLSGNATVANLAGNGVVNMAYQYVHGGNGIVTNYESFTITNYGILADGQDVSEVVSKPVTVDAETCKDVESSMSTYVNVSLVNAVYEEYLETGKILIRQDQDDMFAYTYDEEKLEAYVSAGEDLNKSRATIEIPSTVTYKNKDYRVVGIAKDGFYNCRTLVSIKIPSSITSIGDFAFGGCLSLNEVEFASDSTLTSIPYGAFYGCNSLETITLPASIENIEDWAFGEARALQEVVSKEGQLKTIGAYAFYGCSSFTTIDISNVKQISEYAFASCTSLRLISFSDTLESIGRFAFNKCESLRFCYLPSTVTSIRSDAFTGCTQLIVVSESAENASNVASWSTHWNVSEEYVYWGISKDALVFDQETYYLLENQKAKLIRYLGTEAKVEIPSEIMHNTVSYPVTVIGHMAFKNVTKVAKITFEDESKIESIEDCAFEGCSSLSSIVIPSSVMSIGKDAFKGCSILKICCKTSSQPSDWDSNWNPSNRPVYWNVALIQDGIIYVIADENIVVSGYTSELSNDIVILTTIGINGITYNVTSIDNSVFEDCSFLTSVEIPSSVTSIGDDAFNGCNKLSTITFEEGSKLGSIGNYAFYGCRSLTTIVIPNSVTSIGEYAFASCNKLGTLTFEEGSKLESIGESAFKDCSFLTAIVIPNSVTSIGNSAFNGCSKLSALIFEEGSNLESIGESAFEDCSSLTTIVIPNSVTSIGNSAFNGCNKLSTLTFDKGSKLESIGDYAFEGCSSLTSIVIPNSVTSIGEYAFSGCSSLQYDEYENCLYLGNEDNPYLVLVKAKNTSITEATIHENTRFIMNSAFSGCNHLKTIVIPSGVSSIGDNVFSGCSSLEYNEYGNCLYLGNDENPYLILVKAKDASITEATIHENTRFIMEKAFYNCDKLVTIVIPNSVTNIGENAFSGCDSLSIYCEASSRPSEWNSDWNKNNRPVYWAGEWSYVDGVPTPNQK